VSIGRNMTALAVGLTAAGVIKAAEQDGRSLDVYVGAVRTDNVRRDDRNKESEVVATVGTDFTYSRHRPRFVADIDGDLQYYTYLDNTYGDELGGGVSGEARYRFVPERLEWLFQENFGQVRIDPFTAVTATNRENINYFTTGPEASIALGQETALRLNGTYSNVAYEVSPFDNDRLGGGLSLVRRVSGSAVGSLNARYETVEFDAPELTGGDYDRTEFYGRYDFTRARTTFTLDAGYAELKDDFGSSSGTLARLDVMRQLSPSMSLRLTVGQQFSDAGDIFRQLQGTRGLTIDADSVQASTEPFESRYGTVAWSFDRVRTGFGASASYFEEDYQVTDASDRNRQFFDGYVRRTLSPQLAVQLLGSYSKEDFVAANQDFDELQLNFITRWMFSRDLAASIEYARFKRSEQDREGNISENRLWLRVSYTVFMREGARRSNTLDRAFDSF